MAFTLPPLPYDFAALEPHIDAKTMEIHHGKHHQTYVNNLNAAIEKAPELASKSLDDLMRNVSKLPEAVRTPIRNNGGGHWNHSMFWQIMAPKAGGEPGGALGAAIKSAFGDFAKFREQFSAAGVGRFGSGWAWLINSGGKLSITSTPNQDNPLMEGQKAIMGLDVWEHAYYLDYQNKRIDYVDAVIDKLLNWGFAGQVLEKARNLATA